MNLSVALRLGRVSNQPTVWTNVLAGIVLAGSAGASALSVFVLIAGMAFMYTAGMFLNDAFDADFDRRHRPDRPIPSGEVPTSNVFTAGFAFMVLGMLLVVGTSIPAGGGAAAAASCIALAAAIVLYDWWHKDNRFGPLVMGVCRMLVYITAAIAVTGTLSTRVVGAALVALCYLIGLTYVAKQETLGRVSNLWPLGFLAIPFVYGIPTALHDTASAVMLLALLIWVIYALLFLRAGVRAIGKAVGYLLIRPSLS